MPCQTPSREDLIARIDYDPATGAMTWRARPAHMFRSEAEAAVWNGRCAGHMAFPQRDKDGYARGEMTIGGRRYRLRAHRIAFKILTGEDPEIVDHLDGDPSNNRDWNLRASDKFRNRWNSTGRKARDLPKGVQFSKGRFIATAEVLGVKYVFGRFMILDAAVAAYEAGIAPLHGEFSRGVFA